MAFQASSQPPTAYETLHAFISLEKLDGSAAHPFGSQVSAADDLRNLVTATDQVSAVLNQHLNQPWTDAKVVSALRQRAGIQHSYNTTKHGVQQTLDALCAHVASRTFGEDVPSSPEAIPDWCTARLEEWGRSLGMEAFREEENEGRVPLTLGGEMLVLDVDFQISRDDPAAPKITVMAAKTSYASADRTTTTASSSVSLAGFVQDCFSEFLTLAQVHEDERDVVQIARLAQRIRGHFAYLMRLDKLAKAEGGLGVRWFTGLDELASSLEARAITDASTISGTLSLTTCPLDVYIIRAPALPLPYLRSPSIDFVAYLPPLLYLSLLRSSNGLHSKSNPALPTFDIPISAIRKALAIERSPSGVILATLALASPGIPAAHFVQPVDPAHIPLPALTPEAATTANLPQTHAWELQFKPGVLVSQSRMLAIHQALGLAQGLPGAGGGMLSPSWLDTLLNGSNMSMMTKYYVSSFESPTLLHPPLRLRIQNPVAPAYMPNSEVPILLPEPGYLLERLPVRSMNEVWAALKVVREQAWLNAALLSSNWKPESAIPPQDDYEMKVDSEGATTAELDALLNGTYTPAVLPVTVFLPPSVPSLPGSPMQAQMAVRMEVPNRGPIPGLVDIGVAVEPERKWGFAVNVAEAAPVGFGVEVDSEVLEQVVRRGGLWGLAGRVWKAMAS